MGEGLLYDTGTNYLYNQTFLKFRHNKKNKHLDNLSSVDFVETGDRYEVCKR